MTQPKCRRCGYRYERGAYGEHTRGLQHQRALRADRKAARKPRVAPGD